ncbi:MAG: low molecular weight phosphotyrosine protein phosphatase [Cyclobacteriaceae bacterium]
MIKVLFVCLGNICRSPLAEAIFNQKIKEKGLENVVSSDSAGTSNYHIGEQPDERSIQVSLNHNVPINHLGRQLVRKDGETFTYILAMDRSNHRNTIHTLNNTHEGLFLMRDFDPDETGADVPDPYYGGKDGFQEVYDILDRSIEKFIQFLKEKHDL